MAITADERNNVITLLVGMFDAAPSAELLTGFVSDIESGKTNEELAGDLAATGEFQSLYPVWLTNDEFAANFVNNLLGDNVSDATMQEGVDFVAALLNGGASRGEAVNTAVSALAAVPTDNADWGQAAQQLLNKVDVATYFATTQDIRNASFEELRAITANVTADSESVSNQKMLIDAGLDSTMQYLTAGQDMLNGSAGSDAFIAWIFDNQNTAQSGDMIDGGAGTDTLFAEIGNSQDFAISLKTESVEVASFRAQAVAGDSADNEVLGDMVIGDANNAVQIDAQDMNGTREFWSTDSRADLVIEDVRNNSHETTLGWRNADAGDVDYAVYYDSQHITAPDGTTSGSQLFLELLDLEAAADTGDKLTNNPYVGVKLSVDGVEYTIVGDATITTTYEDLVAALNAALDAAGLDTITASLGEEFKKFSADDGLQYAGTQIVLTNTGAEVLGGIGWIADDVVPADTNVHTAINDAAPSTTTALTQTDIIFDNIGRGSESGDFRAGNMSTGDSGSQGIQQFNIQVQRDSWVTSVSTTNNDLEVVNVVNYEGYNGDLRIGDNGDNDGYTGLEDVRVFNASTMEGDVTLEADLDADIIAKYDDLTDSQAGAARDNVAFAYSTGSGNDTVDLTIAEEAVSYEDLELTIDTGAGNDVVNFEVANDTAALNVNWLVDQAALDNVTIATGAGNDTVNAYGDGEATITTGSGNDTVYSDNSGAGAVWVFNAVNTELADIEGAGAGDSFFLYEGQLTVTFSGGAATGAGLTEGTAAAYANGFESTVDLNLTDYVGNTTDLNQALKAAINDDATLSKFMVAEDGPNNSVVVTSLVDGLFDADDLRVEVSQSLLPAPGAILTTVDAAYEAYMGDSAADVSDVALAAELLVAQTPSGFNGVSVLAQGSYAVTFAGTETGGDTTIEFAGLTVTLADVDTGVEAATAVATAYNAAGGDWFAADDGAGVVTFHPLTAGAVLPEFVITENTADAVVVTATPALADRTGVESTENGNDNVINVGTGSDVVALSTHDDSEETIVFTGTNLGNVDILNFEAGVAEDVLDFSAYLKTETSASGSSESAVDYATTLVNGAVNGISVITITETADDTFAGLTAAELLTAVNGDGDYADIAGVTLDAAGTLANLVGESRDHVVLVHNTANQGEYKAFYLTSDDADADATGDFDSAQLIGTIDLGSDAVAFDVTNFAG